MIGVSFSLLLTDVLAATCARFRESLQIGRIDYQAAHVITFDHQTYASPASWPSPGWDARR